MCSCVLTVVSSDQIVIVLACILALTNIHIVRTVVSLFKASCALRTDARVGESGDHKRLKHHILTQNFKAMGLWVPFLIYPLFPPFLVDMGHNHSHLITQQSPPQV